MNRRAFFAALAAPLVGRALLKSNPAYVVGVDVATSPDYSVVSIEEVWDTDNRACRIRLLDKGGTTVTEFHHPLYYHGRLPFVVFNVQRPYPWEASR